MTEQTAGRVAAVDRLGGSSAAVVEGVDERSLVDTMRASGDRSYLTWLTTMGSGPTCCAELQVRRSSNSPAAPGR